MDERSEGGKASTRGLSRQEALELLSVQGEELEQLIVRADRARALAFGQSVSLCAISNAKSGACPEQCDFCAQSARFRTGAPIFPLKSAREIAEDAAQAAAAGAHRFAIVTSGRSLWHEREAAVLEHALRLIGERTPLERCASLGELPSELFHRFREAGLVRYHHNVETAPSFHAQIVHTHSYEDEVRVVQAARQAGLAICCGGILGLGESPAQRVELAFALRELDVDCVPLNFLDPRPGTPLASRAVLTPDECLHLVALFRLILPDKPIVICGGRERCVADAQPRLFAAGATGLMVGDYLTTRGQSAAADRQLIATAGLQLAATP